MKQNKNARMHKLTDIDIAWLKNLASAGKISEAWSFLASRGDAHAIGASDLANDTPTTQMGLSFRRMVQGNWIKENEHSSDSPDFVFQQANQAHLDNYIRFLDTQQKALAAK